MNTILSCGLKGRCHFQRASLKKNGRHISLISHVLTAAYTWATPQKSPFAGTEDHHDA
jgi:hypothetical protein